MEKGDVHFVVFAILVGFLFFFMLSGSVHESGYSISENETNESSQKSFCVKYTDEDRENDDHNFDGHCQVYFDEIVSVSGVVVGMEYLGQDSVKYNINSKVFKLISEGDEISYRFENKESFVLNVSDILYSSKNELSSYTAFDYSLSREKFRSFCEGVYCTIYLGDSLQIQEHEIEFEEFCTDKDKCNLVIEVDSEEHKIIALKEGSVRKIENLTLSFEEFNIKENYMRFRHNYRMKEVFCNETDRGIDYFNRGSVKGFYENENYTYGQGKIIPFYFEDYCYEFSPTLIEFSCDENEYLVAEKHLCPGNCINGTCIIEVPEAENQSVSLPEVENVTIVENKTVVRSVVVVKKKKGFFESIFGWFGF